MQSSIHKTGENDIAMRLGVALTGIFVVACFVAAGSLSVENTSIAHDQGDLTRDFVSVASAE